MQDNAKPPASTPEPVRGDDLDETLAEIKSTSRLIEMAFSALLNDKKPGHDDYDELNAMHSALIRHTNYCADAHKRFFPG